MHDAVRLERFGICCSVVLTTAFSRQAAYQAEALNAGEVPRVFVRHPISDQTPAVIASRAGDVAEALFASLFDDAAAAKATHPPEAAAAVASGAAAAAAECDD